MGNPERVQVIYEIPTVDPGWTLDDDEPLMPENPEHVECIDLLKSVLRTWVTLRGADALVTSNIALRWNQNHPKMGVDPDVVLVEPAPPLDHIEKSVCTWKVGHSAPRLAIEVVSSSNASMDYLSKPDRYAASGTRELWVFDPLRVGPRKHGGPHILQVFCRDAQGRFQRTYTGPGPFQSPELGAWIVVTNPPRRLRIANDSAGSDLWPTAQESERRIKQAALAAEQAALAAEQAALAEAQTERAQKEAALREIEQLRAELARLRGA